MAYKRKKMLLGGLMGAIGEGVGFLGKNAPAIAMGAAGIASGNPMLAMQGAKGLLTNNIAGS